ncbi:apoptosis-stimulating of p53 protein 2-like isoform X2 [Cynoglossus semilaevis]|uniref:apoptosis-stimulating of p53 protein 2-like isoform X2 n=1 Tax=Cynoglossus semilaevis TaxID=244447 RepID=UPI000495F3AD|nr:apoptosis-stimulating of p53 protein 2-like isoform X2 [Cynoglossus semilaevis]
MMPTFLTVYLSSQDQHFNEVPITPETLCRDVVELCKEPGEGDCYLSEAWRGSERVVGEGERMMEVLLQWGQQRGEVRYLLHHRRAPAQEAGGARDLMMKRNQEEDMLTLTELQDLVERQHQQIDSKEQLLASREQQLWSLKLQDLHHQQGVSDEDRLQQLRENALNQESKLRRVRALRGQVEQKRLSNSKLVEEMEQLNTLFLQKQQELLLAVARVDELNHQLEVLRSNRIDLFPPPPSHHYHHQMSSSSSSRAELERLCKELQLRNRVKQEQHVRLQQQKDALNKKNQEVAVMERRLAELRQRLWKKKNALQQKDNLPLSSNGSNHVHSLSSRVAAVGPYIQSSQGPEHQEVLVKTANADGEATLPTNDSLLKPPPRPPKPATGFSSLTSATLSEWNNCLHEYSSHASTLPHMSNHSEGNESNKSVTDGPGSDVPPPVPPRSNQKTEKVWDKGVSTAEVPPPLPSKTKSCSVSGPQTCSRTAYTTGTFPGKAQTLCGHRTPGHSNTLPLAHKQDPPPAAAVRPYTPDPSDGPLLLHKPQTVATSSIYSMYTQQHTLGRGQQPGGQGSLPRGQTRVYGKPLLLACGGQQSVSFDKAALIPEADNNNNSSEHVGRDPAERSTPRPLSPTKLLPFLSGTLSRRPIDADLDALRRRLHHAPRPLKKRSSITEPEGPAGPNIQKLLYQKTTLSAMETSPPEGACPQEHKPGGEGSAAKVDLMVSETSEEPQSPPPLPPRSPFGPVSPPHTKAEDEVCPTFFEEFPPYPPPPYPSSQEAKPGDHAPGSQLSQMTEQTPAATGKRSILRRVGSDRLTHGMRVKFNPLALLLDSSLEGEYDLVQRVIYDVDDPSMPNDEGITALHNAVCAGHTEIVKFLVQFGVNVNAADSDGWTPLHCAASCNNVQVCKFLVESGAAVFATTYSDMQTAAEKCEEMEEDYIQCSQFLYGVQEKMGVMNHGVVYALWDYEPQRDDELGFRVGDCMTVLRREDGAETEWWWARCGDHEGYIPRNLLGLYLRIKPRQRSLA